MKTIEEEIKQKEFINIFIKTDVNLLFTSSWLQNEFNRFFKKFSITRQQFNVLRILRGQHPNAASLGQITERMVERMSNATRLVEKLQQKGLVTREINLQNRRQLDIRITETGMTLIQKIDKVLIADNSPNRYKQVSAEELELLNDILNRIRN
ncbi:MAG: MarR family transcriptional regulator [Chitinophagales bacterium]|mgnify:CR=1 FL=1